MLKYKDYTGSVEYDAEDNRLFGYVQGLSRTGISYVGDSVDELRADFEAGVDHYLADCAARGVEPEKPYSGRLLLRMPGALHQQVALAARQAGLSINEFINQTLRKEVASA